MSGLRSYHAGLAAEDQVAQHYMRSGRAICARRWRGPSGEIDLIAREGDGLIFIEVKQSRSHDLASSHLSARQLQRIVTAATEFVANEPGGMNTQMRFDLALVDGAGRIDVIENLFLD
jgi:putative endonuclease